MYILNEHFIDNYNIVVLQISIFLRFIGNFVNIKSCLGKIH